MVDDRRDAVIVEKDRSSSPLGWIIGAIVVLVLLALFFMSGGFGLFNDANETTAPAGDTDSINIDTPENINVQPTPTESMEPTETTEPAQ